MSKENAYVESEAETAASGQSNQVVREEIRNKILDFLVGHTVVIWGSGATVDLGFPTMNDLLGIMSKEPGFCEIRDIMGNGFEERLSRFFEQKCPAAQGVFQDRACKIIGQEFTKRENAADDRGKERYYEAMYGLYAFLRDKGNVDILTTNYDCAWERLFAQQTIEYIDGFHGNELDYSSFFGEGACPVRLVKVHGSDNWFRHDTKDSYVEKVGIGCFPRQNASLMSHKIIIPSNMKYEDVSKDTTFANLMLAFGRLIKEADSFLTIGVGFNDLHLTPLLKQEAIKKEKHIVRLMKDARGRGGRVFAEGIPNIITISDAGNDDIPNSSEIVFDVFQKAFQGEFDKARQRLLHFKYLPEKVKDIACFEHFAKELENKNFDNAIEAVRQWKEQVERGKVKATHICCHEKGTTSSLVISDDNLWSLPSFMKLLNEKQV